MMRQLLLTALAAGIAAGLLATLMQQARVIPLILEAERYEALSHAQSQAANQAPSESLEDFRDTRAGRLLVTAAANMLAGIGFGLLLAAAFALHGREVSIPRGMVWGVAGFLVFVGAPALGLPPELPGAPAGDIRARQLWWLGTAAATLAGLIMIFLSNRILLSFAGGFVLALPHALGAPHPDAAAAPPFPVEMAAQFVIASLATNFLFWLFLGGFSAWLFQRLHR